jgi:peptidoglycan/xylan/chitin deacetylase (PgdA/CDA1 family)
MGYRGVFAMLAGMAMMAAYGQGAQGGEAAQVEPAQVERPPQFVMLAFDNCTELERWQDLADFAAEMNRDGPRLHFTFFVSGINFIEDRNRSVYQGPGQRRGYSRINFGGSAEDVSKRVAYANALYAQGHEIASHAIGHFNGAHWSAAQWLHEFSTYRDIVANGSLAAREASATLDVPPDKIVGFRAPYLAAGAGLYDALRRDGFRYDTSGSSFADQWPQKRDGIWRFNLAQLRIAGLGRATLSMDYNFNVAQSRGRTDPRRAGIFKEQMLATYLAYFRASYMGNRAPLNIGHHFEAYQGGAYHEALKEFARRVCGLPEVRCAAYGELADFMDRQSPEMLAAYQRGEFAHATPPVKTAAAP